MTLHTVTERFFPQARSFGLGLALAALCGGAAQAHGDHAVAGIVHTLSHQASDAHLWVLIGAGIPIIALRVLTLQKRDGQEE